MKSTISPSAVVQPRILIVEDNPFQSGILTAFIQHLGMSVVGPVASALEALALCRTEMPDLAILDIRLTGKMDGIELAIKLRALGSIPLVFVSSSNDEQVMQRMQQVHPEAFLLKPYQPNQLQQVINQALSNSSPQFPLAPLNVINSHVEADFFVRENNVLVRLAVVNIVSVRTMHKHAVLTMVSGRRHSVRLSLPEVLAYLPTIDFVQCHRGWIINLRHIEHIELTDNLVRLTNGTEAILGKTFRQNVQQYLRVIG